MEPSVKTPGDYIEILKRRKWSLILPALIIFLVAAVVALTLPSIYKSTATILIEEQEIPADFVATTVTSFVEQRLQSINQRVMTYTKLLDIINRYKLYQDLREKRTTEEIVEKMSEDILFEPISVESMDRRTGRPTTATIAFTLAYEGKHPQTVQQVTNVLTSLFLRENLEVRERQTKETSKFIEAEMGKVQVDLDKVERAIAQFKEKHINELPSLLQLNLQSLQNVQTSIERLNEQLRGLKEKKEYLGSQLADVQPNLGQERRSRLEELKLQLVYLKSRFSDEYPDVIKAKAEIAEIENKVSTWDNLSESPDNKPDNPAYITLAAQLAGSKADIDSVNRQIENFDKMATEYRRRIAATPGVEEEYNSLIVEQVNTQAKYTDLMMKLMEAKVAHGLETEQKGERFTLIEPARLPEKPYKPNRLAILLIGLVLGIGLGSGIAYLREVSDQSVRSARGLAMATGSPVLASIPDIVTKRDILRAKLKRVSLVAGALLVVIAGLAVFHYMVMDLNIFWAKVVRRMPL
jgi:polysaccharide chain length determinant protein (PEP-CTERM system associated)